MNTAVSFNPPFTFNKWKTGEISDLQLKLSHHSQEGQGKYGIAANLARFHLRSMKNLQSHHSQDAYKKFKQNLLEKS